MRPDLDPDRLRAPRGARPLPGGETEGRLPHHALEVPREVDARIVDGQHRRELEYERGA